MAQWTNLKKFVNPMQLYITCETLEACTYVVELGFTAGWQTKFEPGLKFQKFIEIFYFLLCLAKVLHCFSNFDAFSGKHFYKVVL